MIVFDQISKKWFQWIYFSWYGCLWMSFLKNKSYESADTVSFQWKPFFFCKRKKLSYILFVGFQSIGGIAFYILQIQQERIQQMFCCIHRFKLFKARSLFIPFLSFLVCRVVKSDSSKPKVKLVGQKFFQLLWLIVYARDPIAVSRGKGTRGRLFNWRNKETPAT